MHASQDRLLTNQEEKTAQFEYITYLMDNAKLDDAATELLKLHYADLADYLDNANHKVYHLILPFIVTKLNPQTIVSISDANKQPVIEALGPKKSANLLDKLDIEDAIEVIDSLNLQLQDSIFLYLKQSKKRQILEGFKYPENSAGRVLAKDFISLQSDWTVGQAMDFIRQTKISSDFHAAIIVNDELYPVGTILLSTLLKSDINTSISKLMNDEFKVVDTYTELDDLVFIFKQYALTIVPVTNRKGKLVGAISIDNMLYIVDEQTENEFMNLGGIRNRDIFNNLYITAKTRFPWLFVNLITACITSIVINQFSDTISKLITLATMMPIVSSIGGNAGTQAMTVVVRALASREITNSNTIRVITKEMIVSMLNGILLAIIGTILTYLLFSNIKLSIVFAVAVSITLLVAGFLGSAIPIILNRCNIDPAAASAVFLTTCTDTIGCFSFLGLAFIFLT